TLVEAPVGREGEPHAVHLLEDQPGGADGAFEHGGVDAVEVEAFLAEQSPGLARLADAGLAEVDVGPAGEAVFEVPGALSVAEQHELVHKVQLLYLPVRMRA